MGAVRKKEKRKRIFAGKGLPWGMLFISLTGFSIFYSVPFLLSFGYSLMDNPVHRQFCGLQNYRDMFRNPYFLRGFRNTGIFMGISIPLNLVLSMGTAMIIRNRGRLEQFFSLIFLIPLAVPSSTSAFFWQNFFGRYGLLNRILSAFLPEGPDWLSGRYGMAVMVVIFIWKNVGYDMVLFLSGLSSIPKQYYECAETEGAGTGWKFTHITLVYLTPTLFLAGIMTFVNSFKVFREIYLITGEYPSDSLYVLQHYMNHMYLSLHYSRLVSAVYVLTVIVVLLVSIVFRAERRLSRNL